MKNAIEIERVRNGWIIRENVPLGGDEHRIFDWFPEVEHKCDCGNCIEERQDPQELMGMIVCGVCGDKRCPGAENHLNPCVNGPEKSTICEHGQLERKCEVCSEWKPRALAAEAQRDELASEIKRLIYRDKMICASLAKLKAERDSLWANLKAVVNGALS